ncbi:DUF2958 domain-containing protein [Mesorhizobium yinganensis]|uniref:DUF2958 domain-containing protein n=1 Tax=Mesorhizobium yinganensis TaxID=3157707 RepID=UPI0032B830B5
MTSPAHLNDVPEPVLKLPFGMQIEGDHSSTGTYPISTYAEAARETGSITAAIRTLSNATRARPGERM